jgi:hypothetical protein
MHEKCLGCNTTKNLSQSLRWVHCSDIQPTLFLHMKVSETILLSLQTLWHVFTFKGISCRLQIRPHFKPNFNTIQSILYQILVLHCLGNTYAVPINQTPGNMYFKCLFHWLQNYLKLCLYTCSQNVHNNYCTLQNCKTRVQTGT